MRNNKEEIKGDIELLTAWLSLREISKWGYRDK